MFCTCRLSLQDYYAARDYLLKTPKDQLLPAVDAHVSYAGELLASGVAPGVLYVLGTEGLPAAYGHAFAVVKVQNLLRNLGINT